MSPFRLVRQAAPWALCGVVSATSLAAPDDVDSSNLPLRKITLYRSGVGYFERAGEIQGSQVVRLKFDIDQINDILKSMTVLDFGGGDLGPISYGSKEPLGRRLASFGVDISQAPSIEQLFAQLRGAALRADTFDGVVEGTILGVESRPVVSPAGASAAVVNRPHVNLVTDTGVRTLALDTLSSFELADAELAEELRLALSALAEQRAERSKSVDLHLLGPEGTDRTVVVSYIHEMPVWKTSYRLVFAEGDDAPTLQGWAIVENTTDEEWKSVQLSLASGRPSSFTMDLYDPIYTQRPNVPVPTEVGLVARNYESNRMAGSPKKANEDAGGGDTARTLLGRGRRANAASTATLGGGGGGRFDREQMAQAQASGKDAGGQFLYAIDAPVDLARQRSAMLPILLADLEARRVSIYDPADDPDHPLQGVELTNDTTLHLMPGPISVFADGSYAGDAQIPHTARNQKRLLAYALDLDVGAERDTRREENLLRIRIVDGEIEEQRKSRLKVQYRFTNYSNDARTVLIQHARNDGWELVTPEKPLETVGGVHRFELALDSSSKGALEVVEEFVSSSRRTVTSMDLETAIEYRRNGKASADVVEALTQAAALEAQVAKLDRAREELQAERQTIATEQGRIRENLARLDANGALAKRYVEKLTQQEDRLDAIETQSAAVRDALQDARQAFSDFVRNLNID